MTDAETAPAALGTVPEQLPAQSFTAFGVPVRKAMSLLFSGCAAALLLTTDTGAGVAWVLVDKVFG